MSYLDEQPGDVPTPAVVVTQMDRIEAMLGQVLDQQALLLSLLADEEDEDLGEDVVRALDGTVVGTARDQGAPL